MSQKKYIKTGLFEPQLRLNHQRGSRRRATRVAASLVTLHIAADGEGLSAAGVCAAEGFLACVRVGVDTQARGARECLVACAADVAVVVLLVGGGC
jgi:hypothetical protein